MQMISFIHLENILEEKNIRTLDTREYIGALRELVREGREVSMVIAGSSMSPFLVHKRDQIAFREPDRKLKRGDIVFYERVGGQFVCHRIYKIKPEGLYMVGDNQTVIEGPLQESQVFALITRARRKGKWISSGDFWWDFFEKVWIRIIPLRRALLLGYTALSGKRHKGKEIE